MSEAFPSLDLIPTFTAVMKTGSLSGAARQLRLSQPTVRRHIEALEEAFGAPLFTRAQNGLTPTPLAFTLVPQARAVMAQADAFARLGMSGQDEASGRIRITASRVAATYILPPALAALQKAAPGLSVEVAATDDAEDLLARAADIALRFTPPRQAALRAQKLPDVQIGLFHARSLSPEDDLATAPFIADDRAGILLDAMTEMGLPRPQNVVLRSDDPLVQIAAIEAGIGIGVCQCAIAARLGLERFAPETRYHMPAWLVMHEDLAGAPHIRFAFDHLKAALRRAW